MYGRSAFATSTTVWPSCSTKIQLPAAALPRHIASPGLLTVNDPKLLPTIRMGSRRLYLSFDFDHDDELRGSFLAQARRHSHHTIVDCSLAAAVDGNWTREARSRIAQAHVVVFICGENTHSAKGVEAEMTLTQQLRKRYFLTLVRVTRLCSMGSGTASGCATGIPGFSTMPFRNRATCRAPSTACSRDDGH